MTDTQSLMTSLEARIEALESRNAFQDDVIEQLNQELAVHQKQIKELQEHVLLIAQRIKSGNSSTIARPEDEPPPPHY